MYNDVNLLFKLDITSFSYAITDLHMSLTGTYA